MHDGLGPSGRARHPRQDVRVELLDLSPGALHPARRGGHGYEASVPQHGEEALNESRGVGGEVT